MLTEPSAAGSTVFIDQNGAIYLHFKFLDVIRTVQVRLFLLIKYGLYLSEL